MIALFKRARACCALLAANKRGVAVIEMAMVSPVLVLLSVGSFEVSHMVSRQNELQSAISDAESIALAANAGASTDTTTLQSILMSSLSLSKDQVQVTKLYRCNANASLVTSATSCASGAVVSSYVQIRLKDTYTPLWSHFGVSGKINYNLVRLVQLS